MTVESVTYITDLNASYPASGDSRTEGDDHIRNIKTGLAGTFSGFTGAAVTSTEAELNTLDGKTYVAQRDYLATFSTTSSSTLGSTTFTSDKTVLTLLFVNVSLDGVDTIRVEIGDATGYAATSAGAYTIAGTDAAWSGAGPAAVCIGSAGTGIYSGIVRLEKLSSANTWLVSSILSSSATTEVYVAAGYILNSDAADRVRVTTTGAQDFDGGSVQVFAT